MPSGPSYTSEAQFTSIRRVIEDIRGGHIFIPRFQRPFVWNDDQRLELLRSIKASMPVGSLLVWRTSQLRLACYDRLGPHRLPVPPEGADHVRSYLLDGHQRLSTLFGVFVGLHGEAESDGEVNWDIRYNLREEDFELYRDRAAKDPLVRMPDLLDAKSARRLQRELEFQAKVSGWRSEDLDLWTDRIDDLALRIQEYRLPVIPVVTDDLELATRTFSRINSQGTPMSEVHMVAALTWTEQFDLRERMGQLIEALPVGWQGLDERVFLNVLKGLFGFDITKTSRENLAQRISQQPDIVDDAIRALEAAVEVLQTTLRIPSSEFLPYSLQLVLLAVVLHQQPTPTPEVCDRLSDWLRLTTFWETFAGATHAVVQNALRDLRRILEGKEPEWPFPRPDRPATLRRRFDLRAARVRDALLWLASRPGLQDPTSQAIDGLGLVDRHGMRTAMRIVPASEAREDEARQLQMSIANVVVMPPDQHAPFRYRLLHGPDLSEQLLEPHFLSSDLINTLRNGDVVGFLRGRYERVRDADRQRFQEVRARVLGTA